MRTVIAFCDTYRQEAWNQSDHVRIALLLDVWGPDMPVDMQVLSRLIVLFFVQAAMRYRAISYGGEEAARPSSRPRSPR